MKQAQKQKQGQSQKQDQNKTQDKSQQNSTQAQNRTQQNSTQTQNKTQNKNQTQQRGQKKEHEFNEEFMNRAIELSRRASIIEKSGGVFGAVIVKDGKIIAEGYNQVIRHNDPTWHAEMQAIREACKKEGTPHLKNCVLYTSAECCPMCWAAAYWAHIDQVFYGARVEDALKYGDFKDVNILEEIRNPNAEEREIQFIEEMRPEAVEVWKEFSRMPDRARY